MQVIGSCHCAAIRFTLMWEPTPASIPARACSCSFCTKHGAVWTSYPEGTLDVEIARTDCVTTYRFGTRTADFHLCTCCGVVPVATSLIEGRLHAVVNVNTFDADARALVQAAPVNHGNESPSARLARRAKNWIGDVRFGNQPGRVPR